MLLRYLHKINNMHSIIKKKLLNNLFSLYNILTPCSAKSNEYSLIKVVLPDPVGPVNMVSSPRR